MEKGEVMKVVNLVEAESIVSRKQKELRQELMREGEQRVSTDLSSIVENTIEVLEQVKQDIRRRGVDSEILFHK